jgi:hypothetical protein
MNIGSQLKNQIIQDNIDISTFNDKELLQWLLANFVNLLCDVKVFVSTVTAVPIADDLYLSLYRISGEGCRRAQPAVLPLNSSQVYQMEFGILRLAKINKNNLPVVANRVSIAFFTNTKQLNTIFNALDQCDFSVTNLETNKALIIY